MNRLKKLLLAGLALALLAVGLWAYRDQAQARRQARIQAWVAYLRGPLSDLLDGSARARPLLRTRKEGWTKAQRAQLEAARDTVLGSDAALKAILADVDRDPFFKDLKDAQVWHDQMAELARNWLMIGKDLDLRAKALEAQRGVRMGLEACLRKQRQAVADRLHPSQDLWLEQNALLFTLGEP